MSALRRLPIHPGKSATSSTVFQKESDGGRAIKTPKSYSELGSPLTTHTSPWRRYHSSSVSTFATMPLDAAGRLKGLGVSGITSGHGD